MTTESCSVDEHDIKDLCDDVKLAMMAVRMMSLVVMFVTEGVDDAMVDILNDTADDGEDEYYDAYNHDGDGDSVGE